MNQANWWEQRWFLALLIAASAIPLLWPETPPLVDVPGHMARYRVQLDLANSPDLQRYFEFHWALVANLGVDLLVIPLAPIFGLELAVKIIAIWIPILTVTGLLWISKEIHGRVQPTVLFAIPFVYGYPFIFGFTNFSLSLAFGLVAFGLWLRLANAGRLKLRAWLFVPISCLIWLAHAFGWGILGLLAYSSELIRHHERTLLWRSAAPKATVSTLPLALPILFMVIWRSDAIGGKTSQFFSLDHKFLSLFSSLRDRWLIWDSLGLAVAVVLLSAAFVDRRFEISKRLIVPAAILLAAFIIMPGQIFGLSYADTRIAPVMIMIALLAIRERPEHSRLGCRLAWMGLAFALLRIGGNTISFAEADRDMRRWLTALDHIEVGKPVLTLVGEFCNKKWPMPRHSHIGSFVIIRKDGFSNDQWALAGQQLLRVKYTEAGRFTSDRSTYAYSEACLANILEKKGKVPPWYWSTRKSLDRFPKDAFDYVWLIQPPDFDMKAKPGLLPIWRTEDAVLYKVDHSFR